MIQQYKVPWCDQCVNCMIQWYKHKDLSLVPQHPHNTQSTMAQACNLRTREAKTEESLGFVSSLLSINVSINECEGSARDPVFKKWS